jgi:hypothetical protein
MYSAFSKEGGFILGGSRFKICTHPHVHYVTSFRLPFLHIHSDIDSIQLFPTGVESNNKSLLFRGVTFSTKIKTYYSVRVILQQIEELGMECAICCDNPVDRSSYSHSYVPINI